MAVNRFEVYLVNLDPTVGVEVRKTRPCLVVSPDEMNHHVRTAIIAPMTTNGSLPAATASGSGASGGSCDRSSSQAKNRKNGRRCCVT